MQKDLKSKKHRITAMTIEKTILDFQLSNTFEQYEFFMNPETKPIVEASGHIYEGTKITRWVC